MYSYGLARATLPSSPIRERLARVHNRLTPISRIVIERTVSHVFAISLRDLKRQTRGRAHVAAARQVAMYLSHVTCGLSLTDTGNLFQRDRTTVAHACTVVEDKRDNPKFDIVLEMMERAIETMLNLNTRTQWPANND